jgi:hypothetical protein
MQHLSHVIKRRPMTIASQMTYQKEAFRQLGQKAAILVRYRGSEELQKAFTKG